ncbi:uncharacterized protein LOC128092546 [Culex pipiens pallens]|uniref:uncharacterized protein LOC128092546 n=1 Tax=Culex pipiens pallens TaxID=42434 RepID=UPI0022AAE4E2|nr:uncharacterized protein LOC128092546 [Culex pipiens pallens]
MFAMEDSLFGTDPVDEWTMHQLRQILDQQRNLMEKLNVPPLPVVQLVAQEDVPDTCAHVDFSGESSLGAKKAKEIRQPRRHAAVLPAEEKQNSSISAIIQPVATKNLDHYTLPPSETIFNKMAERSSTTLSAIGPQQLPIITTTHTPDNTSAPEDQQQLVNNTVGTLSGTGHTDDILVGDQSKVCHAAVVRHHNRYRQAFPVGIARQAWHAIHPIVLSPVQQGRSSKSITQNNNNGGRGPPGDLHNNSTIVATHQPEQQEA